jgi:hypothetical protein
MVLNAAPASRRGRRDSKKSGHRAPGASNLAASIPAPPRVQRHLDARVARQASTSHVTPAAGHVTWARILTSHAHACNMAGLQQPSIHPSIHPANLSALGESARHTFISNTYHDSL